VRRWLFILLAVVFSGWLLPTASHAHVLTSTPNYDAKSALEKIVVGVGITMDTYGGKQDEPRSLHKYTYCHDNPVSYVDPSGRYVYVRTRPLDINVARNFPGEAVHVYLAFDDSFTGLDEQDWVNLVHSEDDPVSSANSYGIVYQSDPKLTTFSFHPKSVLTGDSSANTWFTVSTPSSYVAYNAPIDKAAFNRLGAGYNGWNVAAGKDIQFQLYKFAIASRNKNNNGNPDPQRYEFTTFNCGSWVQYVLANNGIPFPDAAINEGVGLGGSLSSLGGKVTSAAHSYSDMAADISASFSTLTSVFGF
jgi:hypothetical protein